MKKTALAEYNTSLRSKGIIAISLQEGDEARLDACADGTKDILLTTRARAWRFASTRRRSEPMGRNARRVLGIKLRKGDALVSAVAVEEE